jgi:exodeoxyribonuclease VII small subunit
MTNRPISSRENTEKGPESFEDALRELESLVAKLESGEVPLEESLTAFEKGQRLLRFCEEKLSKAEQLLVRLSREAEGQSSTESDDASPP